MKQISSRQNPLIKNLVALHTSKGRFEQQQFIAEGIRTCSTLINARMKLIQLYVEEEMLQEAQKFTDQKQITIVTPAVMQKISATQNPSGMLAVFAMPKEQSLQNISSGIVLAGIADPGNMGTLIRTCAALGKKTVIIMDGVDPWHPKVVQASAGTLGLVTIFQCTWPQLLEHKKNIKLCALVVTGGKPIATIAGENILFVIGSEAHGIPKEWLGDCDEKITLEMPGKTESLNAAVAGSIALYLAWRKV